MRGLGQEEDDAMATRNEELRLGFRWERERERDLFDIFSSRLALLDATVLSSPHRRKTKLVS
jgi:hypothetical protein